MACIKNEQAWLLTSVSLKLQKSFLMISERWEVNLMVSAMLCISPAGRPAEMFLRTDF